VPPAFRASTGEEDPAAHSRLLKLADMILDNPVERRHVEKRTLAFAKKARIQKKKLDKSKSERLSNLILPLQVSPAQSDS
jgi:hypothetical protein